LAIGAVIPHVHALVKEDFCARLAIGAAQRAISQPGKKQFSLDRATGADRIAVYARHA
jgi:hypothetical protein